MAIKRRGGGKLVLAVDVVSTTRVQQPDGTYLHVVEMASPGNDADTLVLSSR